MMEIDFGREGPEPDDTPDFDYDELPKRERKDWLSYHPDMRDEEDYRGDENE